MTQAGTPQTAEVDPIPQIEALAAELERRGLATKIGADRLNHRCVRAASRGAAHMTEDIYAAQAAGEWSFWWSWADRIGPISDIEGAAKAIAYVLHLSSGPISA